MFRKALPKPHANFWDSYTRKKLGIHNKILETRKFCYMLYQLSIKTFRKLFHWDQRKQLVIFCYYQISLYWVSGVIDNICVTLVCHESFAMTVFRLSCHNSICHMWYLKMSLLCETAPQNTCHTHTHTYTRLALPDDGDTHLFLLSGRHVIFVLGVAGVGVRGVAVGGGLGQGAGAPLVSPAAWASLGRTSLEGDFLWRGQEGKKIR